MENPFNVNYNVNGTNLLTPINSPTNLYPTKCVQVDCSSNGQYVIACSPTAVYLSQNYGSTWTTATGFVTDAIFTDVASSSSGQYLAVIMNNNTLNYSSVYTSQNYGLSWTQQWSYTYTNSTIYSQSITSSSSGQYLALTCSTLISGYIVYTSSNYGFTWTQQTTGLPTSPLISTSIINSSNGQYIAISFLLTGVNNVNYSGGIWFSSTYGNNWTQLNIPPPVNGGYTSVYSVAMSSDGKNLAYGSNVANNYMYTSQNYGATWTQQTTGLPSNGAGYGISSSGTGQYLALVMSSNSTKNIYTSSNYGSSWTINGNGVWYNYCVLSTSGQYLYAINPSYLGVASFTMDIGNIYGSLINELQIAQGSQNNIQTPT